jgi:hypothetical protein
MGSRLDHFLCPALNIHWGSGPSAIVVRLGNNASRGGRRLETDSRLIIRIHTGVEKATAWSGFVIHPIQTTCNTLRQEEFQNLIGRREVIQFDL